MRAALSRPFAAPGRIDPRYAARVRRRAIADRARGAGRLCDARPDPVRTARCAARGLWVHTVQPAIASGVAGMAAADCADGDQRGRSVEHTSELQSLMRIPYAVLCLKKLKTIT